MSFLQNIQNKNLKKTANDTNESLNNKTNTNKFSYMKNNNNSININPSIEEDTFERALSYIDTFFIKSNHTFPADPYEPNYNILYPSEKFETIPLMTPSTRLNKALQIEDKNQSFIYYYTQKYTMFPVIYNQIIGLSGSDQIFKIGESRDFIFANKKTLIFTNEKKFINKDILLNEFITPMLNQYHKNEQEKNIFIDSLFKNILIHSYLTYDELLIKIIDLFRIFSNKEIKDVGLIIIDGINSISPQRVDFNKIEGNNNEIEFKLKFYKHKEIKKKNLINLDDSSSDEKIQENNYEDEKINIYLGKNKKYGNFLDDFRIPPDDELQQGIVNAIMYFQFRFNFNLIMTVFDCQQEIIFNNAMAGKSLNKDFSKNCEIFVNDKLEEEGCSFQFQLPKIYFPQKIIFIEPINQCLNYNYYIFGLLTNNNNSNKLLFQAFKKDEGEFKPKRIVDENEYEYK